MRHSSVYLRWARPQWLEYGGLQALAVLSFTQVKGECVDNSALGQPRRFERDRALNAIRMADSSPVKIHIHLQTVDITSKK